MAFSQTLKDLIKISDTSLRQIADTVCYEHSYISKWYNGKNLPSSKSIDDVAEQLACFFADNLDDYGEHRLITYYPHLTELVHQRDNVEIIKSLIKDAYYVAAKQRKLEDQAKKDFSQVIPALQINNLYRITNEIMRLVYRYIASATEGSTIYGDMDFFHNMPEDYVEDMRFTTPNPLRFHWPPSPTQA